MNSYDLTFPRFLLYLAVMVGITYLLRLVPLLFFRKKIKNRYIRSVLYYIPYTVLTVMTVPAIFYSAPHLITTVIATAVAVLLAFFRRSLITVAAGAAISVFTIELIFMLIA